MVTSNAMTQPTILLEATGKVTGQCHLPIAVYNRNGGGNGATAVDDRQIRIICRSTAHGIFGAHSFRRTALLPLDSNTGVFRQTLAYSFAENVLPELWVFCRPDRYGDVRRCRYDSLGNRQLRDRRKQRARHDDQRSVSITGYCPADPPGKIVDSAAAALGRIPRTRYPRLLSSIIPLWKTARWNYSSKTRSATRRDARARHNGARQLHRSARCVRGFARACISAFSGHHRTCSGGCSWWRSGKGAVSR